MSDRLLRYLAQQKESPRLGRPPHSPKVRFRTMMAAGRELKKQGWTTGWRSVSEARPTLPECLLKTCVPALKKRHRGWLARQRAKRRRTLLVQHPGVMVTQDGFQAAGTKSSPTYAEVLRDAATMQYLGGTVGGATTDEDVVAGLEALGATSGHPLVLGTDNGPYASPTVQAYLNKHGIIWFPSRPYTPQDNGAQERAIREIRNEAGALEELTPSQIAEELCRTTARLNQHRRRLSRGGLSADALTASLPLCDPDLRPRFHAAASNAIARAVAEAAPGQNRVAWREAVLQTLEEFGLARRTGGEAAPAPHYAERLT
ncbi:MAG: hypothetical protein AAB152_03595 [Candidatus Coatesbacteria bacterium]